jgi:hypothetical protein
MYKVLYLDEVENDIIDETKAQVVIIGIIHNKRDNALFLDR